MTEELKIVMDALTTLGAHGKEAFIWWLILKYVLHYVVVLSFIGAAAFVILRVIHAIRTNQEDCRIAGEVALKCGARPGSYYGRDELKAMNEWLRQAEPKQTMQS